MKQIKRDIQALEEDRLAVRTRELLSWTSGRSKQTVQDLVDLIGLYKQLTAEQTRELADYRKEEREPDILYFQMSTSARKRY